MKPIHILLACFLLPGVVKAQTSSANPNSSANDTNLAMEVKALREALLQTQKQMAAQQREIETLKARSKDGATRTVTNEPTSSPRMFFGRLTLRTTSPPISAASHTTTRHKDASANFAPQRSSPA